MASLLEVFLKGKVLVVDFFSFHVGMLLIFDYALESIKKLVSRSGG